MPGKLIEFRLDLRRQYPKKHTTPAESHSETLNLPAIRIALGDESYLLSLSATITREEQRIDQTKD